MKLLIQNNKIVATATDDYQGSEITIDVSDNFDVDARHLYKIQDNQLIMLNDEELLQSLKSIKLQQIQERKNIIRDAGFLVDGILFDSDLPARVAYSELGMQFMSNPEFSTSWKASNGVWVTMDYELYQKVMIAGKTHIESCFMWQANKEIEINAATTVDELNLISI